MSFYADDDDDDDEQDLHDDERVYELLAIKYLRYFGASMGPGARRQTPDTHGTCELLFSGPFQIANEMRNQNACFRLIFGLVKCLRPAKWYLNYLNRRHDYMYYSISLTSL
jgi:hypothetical protein